MKESNCIIKIQNRNLHLLIDELYKIDSSCRNLIFDLSEINHVDVDLMCVITAYIQSNNLHEFNFVRSTSEDVHNYMTRMKFFEINGINVNYPYNEHDANGRFIELKTFGSDDNHLLSYFSDCLKTFDILDDMKRALMHIFAEMFDNAISHASSVFPNVIAAQHKFLDGNFYFSIVDSGIGIPNSMLEITCELNLSDSQTIKYALKDEISSKLKEGHKGKGLYLLHKTLEHINGTMIIQSKKGLVFTERGRTIIRDTSYNWNGTIISLKIPYVSIDIWNEVWEKYYNGEKPLLKFIETDEFF